MELAIRADSYDAAIIKEIPRHYGMLDVEDEIVFDVGACFGAFTDWAIRHGATTVFAYEPLPENCKLWKKNRKQQQWKNKAHLYEAALTNQGLAHMDEVALWLVPNTNNFGQPSTVERRGRQPIMVPALDFYEELEHIQPSVLKMDCEGAEYELLRSPVMPLPPYIKQVAMEIHFGRNEFLDRARDLSVSMLKQGFSPVVVPTIKKGLWHTRGVWKR